jgi:RNA polymerase sigma-70 factor, ECF subfamily
MDTETDILAAAKKMDAETLVKIFDLYSPALYNYVFRLSNDSFLADNIVGDVFAKLLEHLSVGRGPNANLRSYLYEMAYHLVVNEARYSHRLGPLEVVDLLYQNGSPNPVSVFENRIVFEIVIGAIMNDLTADQRHVIILRFLEGFSLKETAEIMGKEVGNVKVIQNRAIAILRKALDYQTAATKAISSVMFNNVQALTGLT